VATDVFDVVLADHVEEDKVALPEVVHALGDQVLLDEAPLHLHAVLVRQVQVNRVVGQVLSALAVADGEAKTPHQNNFAHFFGLLRGHIKL